MQNLGKTKTRWLRRLKKLLKPETWAQSVALIVVVWVVAKVAEKWVELSLDERFKSKGISAEYGQVANLAAGDLNKFAGAHQFETFDRSLDDEVFTNYFVIPVKLRNSTHNPVEKVSFDVDLGCRYAKIIDVQYVVRSPETKNLIVRHTLPKLKWIWPTSAMDVAVPLTYLEGDRIDLFCSVANDRGFGKVNTAPLAGNGAHFLVAPCREPSNWYLISEPAVAFTRGPHPSPNSSAARTQISFRLAGRSFGSLAPPNSSAAGTQISSPASSNYVYSEIIGVWVGAEETEAVAIPNPVFWYPSFRPVQQTNTTTTQPSPNIPRDELRFLEGKTRISLEPGLDPSSEVDLYILAKAAPGWQVQPSVRMDGLPGVSFQVLNACSFIDNTPADHLDQRKKAAMPLMADACGASNKVLVSWNPPLSNYAGVKIFRSEQRATGDYSAVGELIYEGYGKTNDLRLIGTPLAPVAGPLTKPDPDALSTYLNGPSRRSEPVPPPAILSTNLSSPPTIPSTNLSPPSPPRSLILITPGFKGALSFLDTPPERGVVFSYTIYALDSSGQLSYPVVVNAILDSSSANSSFESSDYRP